MKIHENMMINFLIRLFDWKTVLNVLILMPWNGPISEKDNWLWIIVIFDKELFRSWKAKQLNAV